MSMSYENMLQRLDGSFVITKNGLPYHVPNEETFAEEWAAALAYAQLHPEAVSPDPAELESQDGSESENSSPELE